jgi:RNA polymerase sigma-70 factor, ECF subfamily
VPHDADAMTHQPGADQPVRDCLTTAFVEHRRRLVARARRVVVDPALAEEVVQEAFIRAWRAADRFDLSGGPILGWLLVITTNVAKDSVRARSRRPALLVHDPEPFGRHHDGGIERVALRAELGAALAGLSDEHRDAVVQTVLLDRPHAVVAAELGVRPGTLRTRVHYALRRLRTQLEIAC